jgi:diaminopimelate epimerase
MKIKFFKYQGTGNDFIIIDNRDNKYSSLTQKQVFFLCDRRFGIGADGLMLLNLAQGYDFEMKYYNADGRESSMCGNGGRCIVRFANDLGIIKTEYKFLAIDGPHRASINIDNTVSLKMNDVDEIKYENGNFILNTGSPHFVTHANDVMHMDIIKKAKDIRYNHEFKNEGINVNFVQETDEKDKIIVRTYERGVEDETFSCGTGVTAAALVSAHNDNGFNRVEVQTRGGFLSVDFDKIGEEFRNIWLNGPVAKVFDGTIEVPNF